LPDYTTECKPKSEVQQSVTQTKIPSIVTSKHDSSDEETIYLRELEKTPLFLDKQYGIRKYGDTLTIANSTVNMEE
jgi:hypothetical protein